jgi:hypothetical protein
MDLHLGFDVCTFFLVLGTIVVGVPFVVLACAVPERPTDRNLDGTPPYKRLWMALVVFTFGVLLGVLPLVPFFFPEHGSGRPLLHNYVIRSVLPFPSFFAIALSWYLSLPGEGPAKRILQIGAVLLLCIDVLGHSLLLFTAAEGI